MIPTIEQVREHAERYPLPLAHPAGLWRQNASVMPVLVPLRAVGDNVEFSDGAQWRLLAGYQGDWTPCDQAGNPLPLVKERDELTALQAKASFWLGRTNQALDVAQAVLRRLVWRGVADDDVCTCEPDDVCDLCEAMAVLDHPTGRWPGAEQAAAWLSERKESVLTRQVCDVCGELTYRCGARLGHEGLV